MQRIVCGVTDNTTCQDVVIALAHATGKTGRFTLIEKWRDNEHMLAPSENPLNALQKWGEYANDVQLILRHSLSGRNHARSTRNHSGRYLHTFTPPPCQLRRRCQSGVKKALTFSGAHSRATLPGSSVLLHHQRDLSQENSSLDSLEDGCSSVTSHSSSGTSSCASFNAHTKAPPGVFAVSPFVTLENKLLTRSPESSSSSSKTTSPCEDSHHMAPRHHRSCQNNSENTSVPKIDKVNVQNNTFSSKTMIQVNGSTTSEITQSSPGTVAAEDELVRLITKNEKRLKAQNAQVSAFDSEIASWEEKEREAEAKSKAVAAKLCLLESHGKEVDRELGDLELVSWEDKLQMETQRNEHVQSDVTAIRSRLEYCEAEHLKHKNMMQRLQDDIEAVRRKRNEDDEAKKYADIGVLQQISELQKQLNEKLVEHESTRTLAEEDVGELAKLESSVTVRTSQLESLEKQLKEVNMILFAHVAKDVTTQGCSKGSSFRRSSPSRPGSARKLTLPLLLNETVATAKNPHGLWV